MSDSKIALCIFCAFVLYKSIHFIKTFSKKIIKKLLTQNKKHQEAVSVAYNFDLSIIDEFGNEEDLRVKAKIFDSEEGKFIAAIKQDGQPAIEQDFPIIWLN